uniref:Uncharacterized protein n=1 Tax=Vitis vinifera TaxID=29760 RepID=F6HFE3_VITVI
MSLLNLDLAGSGFIIINRVNFQFDL